MVSQLKFLNRLQESLKDPKTANSVLADMKELKNFLTDPAHFRLFIDADVNCLPEEAWKELQVFPTADVSPW